MTDKEKLETLFDLFEVERSGGEKTLKAAGRRFCFNEAGEVVKVQEMDDKGWITLSESKEEA